MDNQETLKNDRDTLNHIEHPIFVHDADYRLVLANDAYCRAAGATEKAVLGKYYWEVFPPGSGPLPECQGIADGKSHKLGRDEVDIGDLRYLSNSYLFRKEGPHGPWYLHILVDITGSTIIDDELHNSNMLLQTIINNIPVRVFWKDRNLRYLGANALFARDGGFTSGDELIGRSDLDMVWGEQAESYRADDAAVMNSGVAKLDYEEQQTTPKGNKIWLRTSKVPLRDSSGDVFGMLGIYYDITDRKKAEDEMLRLATIDQLTGLTNRHQFNLQAQQYLKLAKRENKVLALMMLDLDKFKPVNDTYGHQAGDALLKVVAATLKNHTRETDIVARLGGDEFAILLVNPQDGANAEISAQSIIDEIKKPITVLGHEVEIGVSIGIAIYPADAKDLKTLLKHADEALYRTKETERGTFTFYSPEMSD
ncbi:diguanylate cyclase [Thalassospiraceae bacterium LMO-JJ14]|nr:diguanylate cyclase [Thalassospiraceae bacterium LMO-JJ14]